MSLQRRRVVCVTGSRAEFGLLRDTLRRLERSSVCELSVYAAGMHLAEELGATVREVAAEFTLAGTVAMTPPEDTRPGMARSVADGLAEFARQLSGTANPRADLLLVLGDRTEAFAAALAAGYVGIPVAHIHGGDVTGNPIDDFQRDMISRLATLHFAATDTSARRLRTLGVEGDVQVVGAPGLDAVYGRERATRAGVRRQLGLEHDGWVVVVFHPNPARDSDAADATRAVLAAADELARQRDEAVVVILPNNDAGHAGVLRAIEARRLEPRFHVFESLGRDLFLDLLETSRGLIGNSSAGIIEAGALGVPVVNVGDRQAGRERDDAVRDAAARRQAIVEVAAEAFAQEPEARQRRPSVYGDGRAAERIVASIEARFATPRKPRAREVREVNVQEDTKR